MIQIQAVKWWGAELMHVRRDRQPALISATTTLLGEVAGDSRFRQAALFRSRHGHRVLSLMEMTATALLDHARNLRTRLPPDDPGRPEHLHDIAESRDANAYAIDRHFGDVRYDVDSHDVLGFELIRCEAHHQAGVLAEAARLFERDQAPDGPLLHAAVLGSPDGTRVLVATRWIDRDQYGAFLRSPATQRVLQPGLPAATSEDSDGYRLTTIVAAGGAVTHDPSFALT